MVSNESITLLSITVSLSVRMSSQHLQKLIAAFREGLLTVYKTACHYFTLVRSITINPVWTSRPSSNSRLIACHLTTSACPYISARCVSNEYAHHPCSTLRVYAYAEAIYHMRYCGRLRHALGTKSQSLSARPCITLPQLIQRGILS